jgi:16S rRNA (guanine527-N7)-methyltransferase
MEELLKAAAGANKLSLTEEQQRQLIQYLELIREWNRVYNLTTITHARDMVYLHLIDSLLVLPFLHGTRLLDVGSGAGLPGIPLAVVQPERQWVLMDKVAKKARFMTQAVAELGLKNVEVVQARCEEFHCEPGFDSILSRAFGTLGLFTETTQHLLAPNGIWLALKGKYPEDEVLALPTGIELVRNKRLDLKGMNVERHVMMLKRNDRE